MFQLSFLLLAAIPVLYSAPTNVPDYVQRDIAACDLSFSTRKAQINHLFCDISSDISKEITALKGLDLLPNEMVNEVFQFSSNKKLNAKVNSMEEIKGVILNHFTTLHAEEGMRLLFSFNSAKNSPKLQLADVSPT